MGWSLSRPPLGMPSLADVAGWKVSGHSVTSVVTVSGPTVIVEQSGNIGDGWSASASNASVWDQGLAAGSGVVVS